MGPVRTEIEGNLARITLDAPEKLNAISHEMATSLGDAVRALTSRDDVDVLTLSGAGRMFSSGADMGAMGAAPDKREFFETLSGLLYETFFAIRETPQIFIACVHAKAVGVALPLALCCDLVWLREDTVLVPGYLNLGLFPDGGLTYFLPERMGRTRALELLLAARQIAADEALGAGLAGAILNGNTFAEECDERARTIAAGPIGQYRNTKTVMNAKGGEQFRDHMTRERVALLDSCVQPEFTERLSRALERKESKKRIERK